MLMIAERLTGHAGTCADLIQDERLLDMVLVDETAPTLGTRLSRWTLAQRRSAIRDFVSLMRPELTALLGAIRIPTSIGHCVASRSGWAPGIG